MVSVTKKFQVTIPREVRDDLHIKSGDRVVFVKNQEGNWELMTISTLTKRMMGSINEEITP
ncbi:MAG: AbrB/MazE/SpoVT family DNA-binding domain-containing protein [Euryarchaeota archaeon]|nr:AbrB/MazE/SpoVT family DNA-binding domain-containing protein [Euryarchaeota archaeon]MBU4608167.1 AbrB/MazE/SpoVT family DNA-binding domain-containing protein [Euryarchaeota archaeon]MBV1729282.1 AbrB/MazE/SpoVT family DNA-binding domain-containing protein [Methanobacterium sp.]MBV1755686.1 AbrB/MazE/SpoVT family DNA-binding domain-containing protein [Methanobacterium sp.]MBV1767908.1 AbrB/MazE/SpoVT family DNA-binding domain-containing protein [Methanobacterium sp.]